MGSKHTVAIEKTINTFKQEFAPVADKFEIIQVLKGLPFTAENIRKATHPYPDKESKDMIWHPGCYVIIGSEGVYKVGRHLTNSRKRVLEHINDNTGNKQHQVKQLIGSTEAEVVLFNVKELEDMHWAAAVEIYLELQLEPLISSGRLG